MTQETRIEKGNRFCKACGAPAENGRLCSHCGTVLHFPDADGLVEDEGAAVRRDFEGRAPHPEV
ncbi:hypothetical protein AB0E85_27075 [Streptomyces sp. NPDC029044]|uniref:hypothetical protein n=1 Tax=Streptomyces sp. NPDC029044 TaxID=3157198 RepID=UPI0033FA70BF